MKPSDPRISVVIIAKNEELVLGTCLESVKGADEIIVVDTGSLDKTLEVARKYTDKVFDDYKWNDSFCEARNHALAKATGDWVLSIDADEILHSMEEVRTAVSLADKQQALAVNVKMFASDNGQAHDFPRLFKRCEQNFWRGAIHNHLSTLGETLGNVKITYGYSPAHLLDKDRAMRILEKECKNPENVREMFYLAREYWYRGRFEEALELTGKYVQKSRYLAEKAEAFLMMARIYWKLSMGEDARDACLQALKINANFKEALKFMGELSWPANAERWNQFAEHADNTGVLFVRNV